MRWTLAASIVVALLTAAPGRASDAATLTEGERALEACRAATARQSAEEAAAEADRAEEAFGAALADDPVPAHLGLARTLLECRIEAAPMMEKVALLGRIEEHLGAVLELDPDHADARFLYGALLYNVPPFLNRSGDAIEHLEHLVDGAHARGAAARAEAYLYLGDLHLREGRPERARQVWERGRAEHPGFEAFSRRLESLPETEDVPPGPEAVRQRLEDEVSRPEIPGIAVALARGEEIVLLEGFGLSDVENRVPMTADSIVRIGSITKQLTAVLALRLSEAGRLGFDDPAGRWLPEHAQALAGITVRHLATHTAGLPQDPVGTDDWIERSLAAPRVGAPGERAGYSNLGYALLGRVIEAAGGEPYPDLLERWVTGPAGLVHTRPCDEREIVPHRAQGYTWRGDRLLNDDPVRGTPALLYAGGLCSNARDLLRWQRALHGGEVLEEETYRLLVTPPPVEDPAGTTYAAGLRVHAPRGRRVMRHSGGITGFLTEAAYYPDERIAVVVLVNSEAADPRELGFELAERMAD